jgi:hypothetical protein
MLGVAEKEAHDEAAKPIGIGLRIVARRERRHCCVSSNDLLIEIKTQLLYQEQDLRKKADEGRVLRSRDPEALLP